MSNQTATPPTPRGTNRGKGNATPAPKTRISKPVSAKEAPKRDMFGLYFVGIATAIILLFGLTVFLLRNNNANPTVAPTATTEVTGSLPTFEQESPIANFTPPAIPTHPAPDAINSGEYATGTALASRVGEVSRSSLPAVIPPQIPQPAAQLSVGSFDFGTINFNETPAGVVTIANPSAQLVVIRGLFTDCECIQAGVEATELRSGQRTRLNIRYTPAEDTANGQRTHTLKVVTNDGQEPLKEITITADVR